MSIHTETNASFTTASGETVSCQEIFESVRKSVEIYGKTAGRCLGPEALEDLFQDAVEKVLKYRDSYDPAKSKVTTWVNRIVANCQADAFRKYMRRSTHFVPIVCRDRKGDEYINPMAESAGAGFEAWQQAEMNEADELITKATDSLNENYRFAINLQREGLKPKQMAEIIGCTPDAAATLLCRARKALRKELGRNSPDDNYGIAA